MRSSKSNRLTGITMLTVASMLIMPTVYAANNPVNGQKVFAEECSECHSVKPGKNKKGPSLFAVAGLAAARTIDFEYSDALKKSGIIWTNDKLDSYLHNPKALVPNGKMKYDGLASSDDRSDLTAYLVTLKP